MAAAVVTVAAAVAALIPARPQPARRRALLIR